MKLELKHIDCYCKYGLQGKFFDKIDIVTEIDYQFKIISGLNCGNVHISDFKPILKSLSALIKDNEFEKICKEQIICSDLIITNWNGIIKVEVLGGADELIAIGNEIAGECSYFFYLWLIENHYDIFGLIDNGLAIDINKLNL